MESTVLKPWLAPYPLATPNSVWVKVGKKTGFSSFLATNQGYRIFPGEEHSQYFLFPSLLHLVSRLHCRECGWEIKVLFLYLVPAGKTGIQGSKSSHLRPLMNRSFKLERHAKKAEFTSALRHLVFTEWVYFKRSRSCPHLRRNIIEVLLKGRGRPY